MLVVGKDCADGSCQPEVGDRIYRQPLDFDFTHPAEVRMVSNESKRMIRRNVFLGLWAAKKLGLSGEQADAYAQALAVGTGDEKAEDVFSKVRKDFDAAGVIQSDDQILDAMNDFSLQAGSLGGTTRRGTSTQAASVMIARKLAYRM